MFHSVNKRLEVSAPGLHTLKAMFQEVDKKVPGDVNQLTPTWAWVVILEEIRLAKGFEGLEGLAPAGDLERRVQEFIDSEGKDS